MIDDPAVDACRTFAAAHTDRRIRGAFRLAGTVLTLALAFTLSLAALPAYHDGIVVVIPVPLALCWLAGELVVLARRIVVMVRRAARAPQIPGARVISGHRARA